MKSVVSKSAKRKTSTKAGVKSGKGILVVGSMNVDMVVKTARIPKPGETLLGGVFNQFHGGKGANQAFSASMLCRETFMCAGVGDDSLGRDYLEYFKKQKINISLVRKFKGAHTGVAVIMVGGKGENSISVAPGANMMLTPEHMKALDFSKFSFAVFQLETPLDTVMEGLKRAKEAGCSTVLTPAPARLLPSEILPFIDYIVPNEHEVLLLQKGYKDFEKAAKNLVKKGVGHVIVTLGSKGCMVVDSSGQKRYGVYNVKPVDTVGAGDCFTGSLAAGLKLYGGDIEKAVMLATAAASLSVTRMGAQSARPLADVKKFMAANKIS